MGDTTFEDFKAWLNTKDDDEEFCYSDNSDCAYAQFLKETNRCADPAVGSEDWYPWGDRLNKTMLPRELRPDDIWDKCALNEKTFGDVKKNLRVRGLL